MAKPTPVAWGLMNARTTKMDARLYQSEESAKIGAERHSNRWRTLMAVPLFLHPAAYDEALDA